MKKIYLSGLILSLSILTFLSCTEKKPKKTETKTVNQDALFQENLSKADSLFNIGNYTEASSFYQNALTIQSNNQYIIQKLDEIKIKSATPPEKEIHTKSFHVVIGSFAQKTNAEMLMAKYKNAYIITRDKEQLYSVALANYPDIHTAYNKMYEFEDELSVKAWVLNH